MKSFFMSFLAQWPRRRKGSVRGRQVQQEVLCGLQAQRTWVELHVKYLPSMPKYIFWQVLEGFVPTGIMLSMFFFFFTQPLCAKYPLWPSMPLQTSALRAPPSPLATFLAPPMPWARPRHRLWSAILTCMAMWPRLASRLLQGWAEVTLLAWGLKWTTFSMSFSLFWF